MLGAPYSSRLPKDDIDITLSSTHFEVFDLTYTESGIGPVDGDVHTIAHELLHGLGYITGFKSTDGSIEPWGPTLYDTHLHHNSAPFLDLPAAQRAAAIRSGDDRVFFVGDATSEYALQLVTAGSTSEGLRMHTPQDGYAALSHPVRLHLSRYPDGAESAWC